MSKREAFLRYNLIIKKLRKHPANFDEIAEYLAFESELQEYNFNVSKRTFQRDLEDIRAIYNIDIEYDPSEKVYYIDFDQQPEANERILEAYDTFHALNVAEQLSGYIHFEKRRPKGTENLHGLLHAIKNRVRIKFIYRQYWEQEVTFRNAEPFALKEFKNRWYVIANDLKDHVIKSFALDRLTGLEITKNRFQPPGHFDVNEHFRYCFGIMGANDSKPQEIVLSFTPFQGKYIKSLPLHESQEIIKDDGEALQVRLKLFITYDFLMELLSYGENVKVLKPAALIKDLQAVYKNALNQY